MRNYLILFVADAEIAAEGERLGLLFDLGFLLDFWRALLLALDPLRARRIHACCSALRAAVFHLAVRAGVARRAVAFHLAMRAPIARRAVTFHLAVGAGVARRAVILPLAVRAGGARRAVAFPLAVGAGLARRAVVFPLTLRASLVVSHHAWSVVTSTLRKHPPRHAPRANTREETPGDKIVSQYTRSGVSSLLSF